MTQSADFNIKITVRNARLLRAIRDKFGTSAELARVAGITASQVTALVTMKHKPFLQTGELSSAAEAIVSALGIPPDDLWPDHIRKLKAKRATVELEMDAVKFAQIAADDPEQRVIYRQAISEWSARLSDREKDVLCRRQGGQTLDEIAKTYGRSRDRIRQIECRALNKMRGAAKRSGVQTFQDIAS